MADFLDAVVVAGQKYPLDKFHHCLRVTKYVKDYLSKSECDIYTEGEKDFICTVAVFHDVLEDTDMTRDEFEPFITSAIVGCKRSMFGRDIYEWVKILTHDKENEDYGSYINEVVKAGKIAMIVKRADMKDHFAQKETLTPKLIEKYVEVIDKFL